MLVLGFKVDFGASFHPVAYLPGTDALEAHI
jgi:hypothetical protein